MVDLKVSGECGSCKVAVGQNSVLGKVAVARNEADDMHAQGGVQTQVRRTTAGGAVAIGSRLAANHFWGAPWFQTMPLSITFFKFS